MMGDPIEELLKKMSEVETPELHVSRDVWREIWNTDNARCHVSYKNGKVHGWWRDVHVLIDRVQGWKVVEADGK